MVNRLPRPGSLRTTMWPPACFTIPKHIDSPRPVPWPTSLVVKNGSKIWPIVAASMPTPVSSTSRAT